MFEHFLRPDVIDAVREGSKHAFELARTPEAQGAKSLLKALWGQYRQRLQRADRDRVTAVLESMLDAIQDIDARVATVECHERSAERLALTALETADESPSELKHQILGRAIAARLGTSTESIFDIQERKAVAAIGAVTNQQLLTLTAILMVEHLPAPPDVPTDEISDWGLRAYEKLLSILESNDVTAIDIECLIESQLLEHSLAKSLDGDDDSRNIGSAEGLEMVATFGKPLPELFSRLRGLARLRKTFAPKADDDVRLTQYHLTPAGVIVASFVIEQHASIIVDFTSWGLKRTTGDRKLTQTTATAPETFRQQRRGIIGSQRRFIEETIRKSNVVSEKLSDDVRRSKTSSPMSRFPGA